jgi:hypothetical protein
LIGNYGSPSSPTRVAWALQPNPALQQTAELLKQWHQEGKADKLFNYNPEMGCYCAWFSPEVKYYFDFRFERLQGRADDLVQIRQALNPFLIPLDPRHKGAKEASELINALMERGRFQRQFFSNQRVTHVVFVAAGNAPANTIPIDKLITDRRHFRLAAGDGHAVIFRWWVNPNAAQEARASAFGIDYPALAFGKEVRPATAAGPILLPDPPDFWKKYLQGNPLPGPAVAESLFYVTVFQPESDRTHHLRMRELAIYRFANEVAQAAAISAMAPSVEGGWAVPVSATPAVMGVSFSLAQVWQPQHSRVPAEDLAIALLAVRSAREAVRTNPNDGTAYDNLAQTYLGLRIAELRFTVPPLIQGQEPPLREKLRSIQIACALNNHVRAEPENFGALIKQARFNGQNKFIDAFVESWVAAQSLREKRQDLPRSAEERENIKAEHQFRINDLNERQRRFRSLADRLPLDKLDQKVNLALYGPWEVPGPKGEKHRDVLGLVNEALKILREANLSKFSAAKKTAILAKRMELLLRLGRVQEVKAILDQQPDLRKQVPLLVAQLDAAMGDYQAYETVMAAFENDLAKQEQAFVAERRLLLIPLPPWNAPTLFASQWLQELQNQERDHALSRLAELSLCRALIALETGDVVRAEQLLQKSLNLVPANVFFLDRGVAELYLRQIQLAKGQ